MNETMSETMDETRNPAGLRAGDADRERIAAIIQRAAGEGRLTLAEAEQRLSAAYAAIHYGELAALTADLPGERRRGGMPWPRPADAPVALRVHLAAVVAIASLLITRWIVAGDSFFWPIAPIFWLGLSVAVHARIRAVRQRGAVP